MQSGHHQDKNQQLAKKLQDMKSTLPQLTAAAKNQADKAKTAKPQTPLRPGQPQPPVRRPATDPNRVELRINLNQLFSRFFIYIIIALLFLPSLFNLLSGNAAKEEISLSQMLTDIKEEKVDKMAVAGQELRLTYKDGSQKVTRKEDGQQALEVLQSSDVDLTALNVEVQDVSFGQLFWQFVLNFLPIILMFVLLMLLFRRAQGAQDNILGIGKSKAKVFVKGKQNVSFKDVGGMDEAKKELEEIVDFLKHPGKYKKVGARTPKGVLLVGPSGTGKTLLARAVAGEANVQFLSIAGSEFMEMLVGVGASRVRDLFLTAKRISPSIIFIDEIDAIGRTRGRNSLSSHDEREQTLNQILVEMDGFTPNDNVIVMAATNRGDMLDPALVRPGRFDRRVQVNLPDLEERKYILKIHAANKPFVKNLDWEKAAKRTVGFSGADLENMLNEAAIAVARNNRQEITLEDIEEASMKVKYGPSKKRLQDEHEKKMTAYHEAGHAVLAHVLPYADPVHRISIVSRGHALGYTFTPPEKDKLQILKSELLDDMTVMLGGRAAEMLIFAEQTAGASNDISQVTRIARNMVARFGMSKLGPMNFGPQYEDQDYSRMWGEADRPSNKVQEQVDQEMSLFVKEAETRAAVLLKKFRKQLDAVAAALLDKETLDADDFVKVMGMAKVRPAKLKA